MCRLIAVFLADKLLHSVIVGGDVQELFPLLEQPNPLFISILVGDNKMLLFISALMNAVKM